MCRDDFTCVKCLDKTTELQIDHLYYIKGALPWEYEDSALQTLCRNCHEIKSEIEGFIKVAIPKPLQPVLPRPQPGKCISAWLVAHLGEKSQIKASAMSLYERGRLSAGSVERIIETQGLRNA